MPRQSAPKRTQFSSCDSCRLSRVACDASKTRHSSGGSTSGSAPCSRCNRKKQSCTFEWMKHAKAKVSIPSQKKFIPPQSHPPEPEREHRTRTRRQLNPDSPTPRSTHSITTNLPPSHNPPAIPHIATNTENADHSEAQSPFAEPTENPLISCAKHVFHHTFSSTFGILLGRYGCPLVDDPDSDISIPVTSVVQTLDAEMGGSVEPHSSITPPPSLLQRTNDAIQRCLDHAILAFTARWFPSHLQASSTQSLALHTWRSSRVDMLTLLPRASYRSALALYLFAQTPVPEGISEAEELTGTTAQVCVHTALMHIQKLRQRRNLRGESRNRTHRSAYTAVGAENAASTAQIDGTAVLLDLESRMYWAAVTWDTSTALHTSLRTALTSGLNGACSEPAWRLARAFLASSFTPARQPWLAAPSVPVTDETASRVVGAASISQVYTWKNIASLNEALREGTDEDTVLWVWRALQSSLRTFRGSLRPLLRACEDAIHFLCAPNRFAWFEVMLRHCLGVMVLLDVLDVVGCAEIMGQLDDVRDEVEHECFAVLKFGTDNVYHVPTQSHTTESESASSFCADEPMKISFVAMYAFPHHLVRLAQLAYSAIAQKHREARLDRNTCAHLSSILLDALAQLGTTSKTVRCARMELEDLTKDFIASLP